MKAVINEIQFQLRQDHEYYHNSLYNRSFHLISGLLNFLAIFVALSGEVVGGCSIFITSWLLRQSGHFFFESKNYDFKAGKSFQEKEDEKIGANLERKRYMILGLIFFAAFYTVFPQSLTSLSQYLGMKAESSLEALAHFTISVFLVTWVLRTVWLVLFHNPLRGFSWFLKILYDPINDVVMYHRSPLELFRSIRKERLNV